MRGVLTVAVQELGEKYFGVTFDAAELRLLPFVHFCATNGGVLDASKLKLNEMAILKRWEKARKLKIEDDYPHPRIVLTKKTYDGICKILWEAYTYKGLSKI